MKHIVKDRLFWPIIIAAILAVGFFAAFLVPDSIFIDGGSPITNPFWRFMFKWLMFSFFATCLGVIIGMIGVFDAM